MILLALLLAAAPLPLLDEVLRVPGGESRTVALSLHQPAATLACSFAVDHGRSGVRLMVLSREQAERLSAGRGYSTLAGSAYRHSGTLRAALPGPGDYVVVVDNRLEGRAAAEVHLQVSMLFDDPHPAVRHATRPRQVAVIAAAFAFFAACCLAAWRRLGPAIGARR
jgi:hypothetical protein